MKYQVMPDLAEGEYKELMEDIKSRGVQVAVEYDDEGNVLDGHHRIKICGELGITDFPKIIRNGMNEDEKLTHIRKLNMARRQLTQVQRRELIATELKQAPEKSDRQIAKGLGVDHKTVGAVRKKKETGGEIPHQETVIGQDDIVQPRQKKLTPKIFNYQNTDNIEWAKWSWNPFVGCEHGCVYCYARDIANRFYGHFEPQWFEERLEAPFNTKIPTDKINELGIRNVFLGSMTDFFGDFINADWIVRTLEAVRKTPQWIYLVLTKNPERIIEFVPLPRNMWVGTTVDTQARVAAAQEAFQHLDNSNAAVTFLSCEPLRGKLDFADMSIFDWVIIGGQSRSSGEPAAQPKWEWVEHLLIQARGAGCKVYFKPSLTIRPREYPERKVKCL